MLTISLLNYKNWRETEACIRGLFAACAGTSYRVLVRDNSEISQISALRETLRDAPEPVLYFESHDNPGFARGHNQNFRAVRHKEGDLFLVLNNDTEILDSNVFKAMLSSCNPHRVISCVLVTQGNREIWFSGGSIHRWTGDLHLDRSDFHVPIRSTAFISGCCMMLPASLYERLGGFDESFFMYAEDLDLCLRARAAGAELAVVNGRMIHRVGSGERGRYSDLYLYENTRNRLICLRRHRLGIRIVALIYFLLKYGVVRTLQLALRSRNPSRQVRKVWWGILDGIS